MAQGRAAFEANGSRSASQIRLIDDRQGAGANRRGRGRARGRACPPAGCRPPAGRRRRRGPDGRRRRVGSKGAVADDVAGAGQPQVQHRRAATSKPAAAQSAPISAPVRKAARRPARRSAANSGRSRRRAGGRASAAGAGGRRGRLPGPPSARHSAAGRAQRRHQGGELRWAMLRANRITPAGGWARSRAASSGRIGPAMPTMAAFMRRSIACRRRKSCHRVLPSRCGPDAWCRRRKLALRQWNRAGLQPWQSGEPRSERNPRGMITAGAATVHPEKRCCQNLILIGVRFKADTGKAKPRREGKATQNHLSIDPRKCEMLTQRVIGSAIIERSPDRASPPRGLAARRPVRGHRRAPLFV